MFFPGVLVDERTVTHIKVPFSAVFRNSSNFSRHSIAPRKHAISSVYAAITASPIVLITVPPDFAIASRKTSK